MDLPGSVSKHRFLKDLLITQFTFDNSIRCFQMYMLPNSSSRKVHPNPEYRKLKFPYIKSLKTKTINYCTISHIDHLQFFNQQIYQLQEVTTSNLLLVSKKLGKNNVELESFTLRRCEYQLYKNMITGVIPLWLLIIIIGGYNSLGRS